MMTRILMKALGRAAVTAIFGAVLLAALAQVGRSPLLAALTELQPYFAFAVLALVILPLAATTVRTWAWSEGNGVMCDLCGGPLGAEKSGRYGTYRTCMGCSKHRNIKHWQGQTDGAV